MKRASLLGIVYSELLRSVPKELEFSTEELLQAAEALIELSKNEYIYPNERERVERPTYFSRDVSKVFESQMWYVAAQEAKIACEDVIDYEITKKIKRIVGGSREDMILELIQYDE